MLLDVCSLHQLRRNSIRRASFRLRVCRLLMRYPERPHFSGKAHYDAIVSCHRNTQRHRSWPGLRLAHRQPSLHMACAFSNVLIHRILDWRHHWLFGFLFKFWRFFLAFPSFSDAAYLARWSSGPCSSQDEALYLVQAFDTFHRLSRQRV